MIRPLLYVDIPSGTSVQKLMEMIRSPIGSGAAAHNTGNSQWDWVGWLRFPKPALMFAKRVEE